MTNYEYYKSKGICPQCGSENAVKGRILCATCYERHADATRRYKVKMTEKQRATEVEKNRVRCKARYDLWKDMGVCVLCGNRRPMRGKTICPVCSNKRRIRDKIYHQEKRDGKR